MRGATRMVHFFRVAGIVMTVLAAPAMADNPSVFPITSAPADRLVDAAPPAASRRSASLFLGTRDSGFFASLSGASSGARQPGRVGRGAAPQLLDLIARAEAGPAGYDAVQHGARIRPPGPPTQMTLAEIHEWIAATPGQPHAIGRYQFIPATLRHVTEVTGLARDTRFSAGVQDRLAHVLLEQAGFQSFRSGDLDRRIFMRNLARIWAGLPLPNGNSYYEGHAGNRATMTWDSFETGMARIFPTDGARLPQS